eukprot:gene6856-11020_t
MDDLIDSKNVSDDEHLFPENFSEIWLDIAKKPTCEFNGVKFHEYIEN